MTTKFTFSEAAFNAVTEDFNEYLADEGMPTVQPRSAYSGRGMNGRHCIGFIHPYPHSLMLSLGMFLARCDEKNLHTDWHTSIKAVIRAFDASRVQSDAMGRSYITYMPDIEIEGTNGDDG